MKQTSLGHYTATSESIRNLTWAYFIGDDPVDPALPGQDAWNRDQQLKIECTIDVDLDLIHRQTQTDNRTVFGWVIIVRSDAPKVLASTPVRAQEGLHRLSFSIPGTEVAGRVRCDLALGVIRGAEEPTNHFTPHLQGHLILTSSDRLQLEGTGAQLPLLPVSFKEHGIVQSSDGLWWLRVNHRDLDAPASSALWLWLNRDNPAIAALLENSNEPQHDMLATLMASDFSRQLLHLALTVDDLDLDADYPEYSLGLTLAGIVRLVGETLPQVKLAYQNDPGTIEAQLQALVVSAAESAP